MSALENLNNAIACLSLHAPGSTASQGVKDACAQLVSTWVSWWQSGERGYLPDALLSAKAQRFLQWYARAYVLVPQAVRNRCPDPRSVNVDWSSMAADTMRRTMEEYKRAADATASSASSVTKGVLAASKSLSEDIARAGSAVAAPITAYGNAVRNAVLAVTGAYLVFVFVRR